MRIGPQPRGARGTVEHPDSALDLRLGLAVFGLLSCAVLAAVLGRLGWWPAVAVVVAVAAVTVVDLVVIQARRRARRRDAGDRR
jgi:hypothetical protein